MEKYHDGWSLTGSSVVNDTKMRLDRRPLTRSASALYEDLGESGFNASRPRRVRNKKDSEPIGNESARGRRGDSSKMDADDSGSEDELLLSEDRESSVDCVVGRSRVVNEKKEEELEPENHHQRAVLRSKSLKGLKFNKNKNSRPTDDKPILKEKQRSKNSATSEDSDSRARKQLSSHKTSFSDKPSSSVLKPVKQSELANNSDLKPQATSSESSESPSHREQTTQLNKRSQYVDPSSSDDEEQVEQVNGKSESRKPRRFSYSPPSVLPERTVERRARGFPILSPLHTPVKQRSSESSSFSPFPTNKDPDRTPAPIKLNPRQIPLPSPLSSQPASDYTRTKRYHEEPQTLSKLRPFPMAIGGDSIGNSPPSDTSTGSIARKRLPDDIETNGQSIRKRKRREDEFPLSESTVLQDMHDHDDEDYDSFFNSGIDPKILCPFCDSRLPKTPSPLLQSMIKDAVEKSKSQPRPTNRLGRKAAMSIYIHICQRHHFEAELLPQAEAKGWPKIIEFNRLEARVAKLKSYLQNIIEDDKWQDQLSGDPDLWGLEADSPRALCVFWQEALKEVKEKGSKVAANIKNQFSTFDRTQPGYYGELGSIIIHHALYELFPPASIEPKVVEPLDPKEFIQRVLVPEVGVRLIMEDRKLRGASGFNEAIEILRESSAYGVAMFPEDGGGDSRKGRKREGNKSEIATVDAMLQDKARRRRIELEEEDEREEDEMRKQKISLKRKPQTAPVATTAQPTASRSRPKPKKVDKPSTRADGNALDEAEWIQMDLDFGGASSVERNPLKIPIPPSPTGSQTSRSGHASKRKAAETAKLKIINISSEDSSDEADLRPKDDQRSKGKQRAASRAPGQYTDDNENTPKPLTKSTLQKARERKGRGCAGGGSWSRSMRSDPPSPASSPC